MSNKVGRPSIYDPEKHPAEAEYCAAEGMINQEIAAYLNISTSTLHEWTQLHEEFASAIKRGKAVADDKVEKSLYKRAMGQYVEEVKTTKEGDTVTKIEKTEKYIADTAAMIFWLKNRKPHEWRDKRETELSSAEDKPLVVKVLKGVSMDDL